MGAWVGRTPSQHLPIGEFTRIKWRFGRCIVERRVDRHRLVGESTAEHTPVSSDPIPRPVETSLVSIVPGIVFDDPVPLICRKIVERHRDCTAGAVTGL